MLLNRARALLEGIAEALGGEVAGDPRRWRDENEVFAVVCFGAHPEPLLEHFERIPQIVSILERSERRAIGVTVEGVPVELVVAEPGRFGTELLRATGSREYVEALEPLPEALRRRGGLSRARHPLLPARAPRAAVSRRAAPARRARGDPRRPACAHDVVGREGDGARDGRGGARIAATSTWRSATTRGTCASCPGSTRTMSAQQAEEIAAANERLAPFRILRGIECDILPDGSLDLPDDVLAELDWVQASVHAGQRAPAGEITRQDDRGDAPPGGERASATRRAGSSTTGRRTRSTSSRCSRLRWRPASRSR